MRYLSLSFLACLIVCIDRLHKQSLDLRDNKGFFDEGVKLGFCQNLCQWCDAFNGYTTGDKVMRPFASVAFFVVGDTVFKLLFFYVGVARVCVRFLPSPLPIGEWFSVLP